MSERLTRRAVRTPWDAGAPPLSTIPEAPPVPVPARSPIMARYKTRPDKQAEVIANVRAWGRLKRMSREPSPYAERRSR
jgi:hypothetical protein